MSKELNIYQKLNNFKNLVGAIRKDKNNPFHKSKYADINSVIEVIAQPLSKSGLIDVDTTKIDENGQMYLVTKIVNIDNPNEFLEIETPLLLKDKNNPQALGSSLTYNRRYNRVTLLGLEQEDDDGNLAIGYNQNQKPPKLILWENIINRFGGDKESAKKFVELAKIQGYNLEDIKILNNPSFQKLITEYKNGNI